MKPGIRITARPESDWLPMALKIAQKTIGLDLVPITPIEMKSDGGLLPYMDFKYNKLLNK